MLLLWHRVCSRLIYHWFLCGRCFFFCCFLSGSISHRLFFDRLWIASERHRTDRAMGYGTSI